MGKYAKALVAALVAGGSVLVTSLDDQVVTGAEWFTVAGAVLAALGITYAVPNARQSEQSRSY